MGDGLIIVALWLHKQKDEHAKNQDDEQEQNLPLRSLFLVASGLCFVSMADYQQITNPGLPPQALYQHP